MKSTIDTSSHFVPSPRRGDHPGSTVKFRPSQVLFERFTLSQRLQHMTLIVSFCILMVTGLPLLTPSAPLIKGIFSFRGSFELRGLLHRVGVVMLIALSVYHVLYSLLSERGSSDVRAFMFRRKDLADLVAFVRHNLGLSDCPPNYGRFNFTEKFEYLSLVWGCIIMIATGLILWQEEAAMAIFPKWVLDASRAVHGYEALLAFLAIIVWHLYTVHLSPDHLPMNKVWITGTLDEAEMEKHHPLEYEAIMGEASGSGFESPQVTIVLALQPCPSLSAGTTLLRQTASSIITARLAKGCWQAESFSPLI